MKQTGMDEHVFCMSDIEEPIDTWLHRPIARFLVSHLQHTKVSPNLLTVCSGVLGIAAGCCIGMAGASPF